MATVDVTAPPPPPTTSRPSSLCSERSCSPTRRCTAWSSRRACGPRTSTATSTASIYGAMLELYEDSRRDRRPHGHRAPAPARAGSRRSAARARSTRLAGAVPAAGNVRHYAQIVRENALIARAAQRRRTRSSPASSPTTAPRATSWSAPSARCSRSPTTTARRTSARSRTCSTTSWTSSTSCRSTAPRSPARVRASTRSTTLTGGFQPGNLIIIAARPGMGKIAAWSPTSPRTPR